MEIVAFVFFWLGDHAFLVLFACIGLGLWAKPPAKKNPRVITPEGEHRGSRMWLAVLLFVFGFVNLVASALWVNPLVLAASVRGEGVVLSIHETNTTHNKSGSLNRACSCGAWTARRRRRRFCRRAVNSCRRSRGARRCRGPG